jgi:hypothetical protein
MQVKQYRHWGLLQYVLDASLAHQMGCGSGVTLASRVNDSRDELMMLPYISRFLQIFLDVTLFTPITNAETPATQQTNPRAARSCEAVNFLCGIMWMV